MEAQLKEALLYDQMPDERVLCRLCPHYCEIKPGQRGLCQVRENQSGRLYSLVFGRTLVENIDSIEKKPLFHYNPGSLTYSIATGGCNFRCAFCTNWQVSQMSAEEFAKAGTIATPETIVDRAIAAECRSIAYTYVEPTIFFEYMIEIAQAARAAGLANVIKTNGFLSHEALAIGSTLWNAVNVDLKAFCDRSYQQMGGRLEPVLETLRGLKARDIWVEITTVVIPGVNDGAAELRAIAEFIANDLGVETPWHVTRFFPAYGMQQTPPTPVETLLAARTIGQTAGLHHVYVNNLFGAGLQDTICRRCGGTLIQRRGSELIENRLQNCRCVDCEAIVHIMI